MKKSLIAVAVLASAAGGALTYQQMQLQQLVQHQVNQVVAGIDGTVVEGAQLKAVLSQHNGGLLESDGQIRVTIADQPDTQFSISYRVNHSLATAISGATYTAEITNPVLAGSSDETLTQMLFNGQPLRISGKAQTSGMTGVMAIPAIDIQESDTESLQTQPAHIDFALDSFNGEAYAQAKVEMVIPSMVLKTDSEGVDLAGLKLGFVSTETQRVEGTLTLSLDSLRLLQEGVQAAEAPTLSGLVVKSSTAITEQLSTDFTINAKSLDIPAMNVQLTDIGLGYRLHGIDGETVKQAALLLKESTEQGLSEEQMGEQLIGLVRQRADHQLAFNPTFEVDQFRMTQDGEPLFDVKGKVSILGDKMPANYLSNLIDNQIEPDPSVILQASSASLDATLSDTAAVMLAMFDPSISELIQQSGNRISFKLENGEGVFNGRRVL